MFLFVVGENEEDLGPPHVQLAFNCFLVDLKTGKHMVVCITCIERSLFQNLTTFWIVVNYHLLYMNSKITKKEKEGQWSVRCQNANKSVYVWRKKRPNSSKPKQPGNLKHSIDKGSKVNRSFWLCWTMYLLLQLLYNM